MPTRSTRSRSCSEIGTILRERLDEEKRGSSSWRVRLTPEHVGAAEPLAETVLPRRTLEGLATADALSRKADKRDAKEMNNLRFRGEDCGLTFRKPG